MDCEGVAKVVQARLIAPTIGPADTSLFPDALKRFLNIPEVYPLTIVFDKEGCVVVLCVPGLLTEGGVSLKLFVEQ